MPVPIRRLGFGLVLALGACATLQEAGLPVPGAEAACGADSRQDWVGQSVASLNDIDLPEGTRVLFPTTPVTQDFNPERLNVAIDASDTISRVYCG